MIRGSKCDELNCTNPVQARGLCSTHYKRWQKYESEGKIVKGWGERRKHPLYETWRWIQRKKGVDICDEWKDFHTFLNDVGDRPSEHHRLVKIDYTKPHSPDNSYWRENASKRYSHESREERTARYARERRAYCPDTNRNYRLKKTFGITLDEYNKMFSDQEGVCAICGAPPSDENKVTRKFANLCVDHDHTTGKIRGLLCHNCNRSIGLLKDNAEVLRKAADYLDKNR